MQITDEVLKSIIASALREVGVEYSGKGNDARRWSSSDLATDLAPLVREGIVRAMVSAAVPERPQGGYGASSDSDQDAE